MPLREPGEVTRLLESLSNGGGQSAEQLLPVVYDELRRLAQGYVSSERANHTLSATALVHEVYLRLVRQETIAARDRREFFGIAASAMRRILVDHARTRNRQKRGGGHLVLTLDEHVAEVECRALDLLALDDALERLAEIDPIKAKLVELRFFGGLPMQDAADMLELSLRTVERHWTMARAWLRIQVGDREES